MSDYNRISQENEALKKEIADLKVELVNANKRVDESKSSQKLLNKTIEQMRTEKFLIDQKLESFEQEHKEIVHSNTILIEELQLKLKSAEKKVAELEEEAQEIEAGEGLDEIDIPLGEFKRDRMPSRSFRNSIQLKAPSILSGGHMNKSSVMSNNKSGKDSGAASPNLIAKMKDLESQQEKSKELIATLKAEIASLTTKVETETARAESARIKAESRENELENLRKKIVYDCERYIMSLNEANEEIDKRDTQLKNLQRQLRNIGLAAPSVSSSAGGKAPPTTAQKQVAAVVGKAVGIGKK